MTNCDDATGIHIIPPKDPSFAERLGYDEIAIAKTDANGQVVTVYVPGKIEGGTNG